MSQDRRNDYDVTNTVQVSNPVAVRNAVHELYAETFPGMSFDKLWLAFYDFERLFSVSGLPDNFVFIKIGKEAAQPVASRCLVVNDKHAGGGLWVERQSFDLGCVH